jgi:hypothetical protein
MEICSYFSRNTNSDLPKCVKNKASVCYLWGHFKMSHPLWLRGPATFNHADILTIYNLNKVRRYSAKAEQIKHAPHNAEGVGL